ncbi:UdgX family uracil-DNA binding protein [Pseudactinotalea suaedae]|uniref:UdgX family uracil-DNA binding protein n=1 Tax=Pseudactinotalea suaedae TaxID=1524924 RepID=UPI0012E226AA|nr:UdgX family uracil-DNA binding protein [Pseudactinotalea suaedae]
MTDAAPWLPAKRTLSALQRAAPACRGCELWEDATQVVFGDGASTAAIMLVGEQPGDREDLEGEPFVGPAGRVLDDALDAAGVDRDQTYLTNAVKHFRFDQRGPRRIHKKPGVAHIEACHPWLEAELEAVRPRVVVALGASAGRALLGRPVRVTAERGRLIDGADDAPPLVLTAHPSALLRLRSTGGFEEAFELLVADLGLAAAQV